MLSMLFTVGLWRTRQTEDTKVDRELHIRTTLRELIIYIIFVIILCICKYIDFEARPSTSS